MRIVFLGINSIGRRIYDWLLAQGEEVVALVTDKSGLDEVAKHQPDLVVSGGYRHIVPQGVLDIPRLGGINVHKSLLPWNRGANPVVWSILHGTPAGVSIHRMNEGIDTGDILAQAEVPTSFADTAATLYARLEEAQFELFTAFWPKFTAGHVEAVPQDHVGSYHRITEFKVLRRIDPEQTWRAKDFLDLLRAMTFPPFNNCFVENDGRNYFLRLEITPGEFTEVSPGETGGLRQYGD